jgi:hypothetical protein
MNTARTEETEAPLVLATFVMLLRGLKVAISGKTPYDGRYSTDKHRRTGD